MHFKLSVCKHTESTAYSSYSNDVLYKITKFNIIAMRFLRCNKEKFQCHGVFTLHYLHFEGGLFISPGVSIIIIVGVALVVVVYVAIMIVCVMYLQR